MPPSLQGSSSNSMGNLQNSFQIGRNKYASSKGNGPIGARSSNSVRNSDERAHTRSNPPILTVSSNKKRRRSAAFKPDVSPLTLRPTQQHTSHHDVALALRTNSSDETIDNISKSSSPKTGTDRGNTISGSSSSTAPTDDGRCPSFKFYTDSGQRVGDKTSHPPGSLTSTKSTNSSIRHGGASSKASFPAKFRCTQCQGDVRRPPLHMTDTFSDGENKTKTPPQQFQPVIFCSSQKCRSPQYHLHCSGIPKKSQIFYNATSFDRETFLAFECTAHSLETAWWNIPIRRDLLSGHDRVPSKLSSRDAIFGAFQFYEKDPMSSVSSFVCSSCDVEGTSRYLLEYFEIFHAMKKSFYSRYLNENSAVRLERMSECVEARVGDEILHHWMRIHAIDSKQDELVTCNGISQKVSQGISMGDCVGSELNISHMTKVLRLLSKQLPLDTQKFTPSDNEKKRTVGIGSAMLNRKSCTGETTSQTASRAKNARTPFRATGYNENNFYVECTSNQEHGAHTPSEVDFDAVYHDKFKLDPTYLVGMPIQMFNPIDNSYHSGRIVNCKMNAAFKVDKSEVDSKIIGKLVDEDISKTMYLVRFREGVEGRKVTLHQWLYLEEHAVIVGAEVCWAKISGDTVQSIDCEPSSLVMSPYRPVQLVFRSMLEMISISNRKDADRVSTDGVSSISVLARGFGDVFSWVRITLQESDSSPKESSNAFAPSAEGNPPLKASDGSSGFGLVAKGDTTKHRPTIFPFQFRDPLWLNEMLRRVRLTDEDVGVAVAMACVEKNEKRMIRSSQNLEN